MEKLVCADAGLIELDERLDVEYKKAIALPSSRDFLRRDQREWLTKRNYCSERQCIQAAYETRIGELRALLGASKGPYSLVYGPDDPHERDAQAPMCLQVLKNLNDLNYEPPMTCQRVFDPSYTYLGVPAWKALSASEALEAALAWERNSAEGGPPDEIESRFASRTAHVKTIAKGGDLKAWQATLDIVSNGHAARVVLLNYGRYRFEDQCYDDTKLAVLLPDRFQVDRRYKTLSFSTGEVILYRGKAYIASWSVAPGATKYNRAAPRRQRNHGYLLINSAVWYEGASAPPGGIALVFDTVCQIAYQPPRQKGKAPGK